MRLLRFPSRSVTTDHGWFFNGTVEKSLVDDARKRPDDRREPEQPELPSAQPPTKIAGPVLRAGFTDVLVTGMLMR